MIRVALGSVPKDGGTFTFYRNLRPALRELGIELRCVTLGRAQNRLWDEGFADDGCVRLAPEVRGLKQQAEAFTTWCLAEHIDIAIGINSEGILAAIPHLPYRIRVVARCANGFEQGYRLTMAGGQRINRIVALTPRLRDDLVHDYGADPERVLLIPNGIAEAPFNTAARRARGRGEVLELVFLGRLEHNQKGVMHLPAIVDGLQRRGVRFRLSIAGKGRHEPELRQALAAHEMAGAVAFVGALTPREVPSFLGSGDVFIFTSHFEGCPNALLEAMMAGAVPVAWRVTGITDYLLEHGETGLLCTPGDAECMANSIAAFAENRPRLEAMHRTVAATARARFASSVAARAYGELFREVMRAPEPELQPRPWRDFRPEPCLLPSWRGRVPAPVRDALRPLVALLKSPRGPRRWRDA